LPSLANDRVDVLLVGGGGREHALAWKLSQSPLLGKLYCAPGNPGIAAHAECVPISATDIDGVVGLAKEKRVGLVLVGPESPLIAGLVDRLQAEGIPVFGPRRDAAAIEGSKSFAKRIMQIGGVPTASCEVFDDADAALSYLRQHPGPVVVKADGEAAGKGAIVCDDERQAMDAVRAIMVERVFGSSGDRVVIEERMYGEEFSALAFVQGEKYILMPASQDHKPVLDGDRGPNTGGMGAYSPVPSVTQDVQRFVEERVFRPVLAALTSQGIRYQGVLYAGMMLTAAGPRVVEFNCRFGDPEAQVVLTRMASDLMEPLLAVAKGDLSAVECEWKPAHSVCVVMASRGYPGAYEKGKAITGLDAVAQMPNVVVFHAGTAQANGAVVTAGGRVLGVTAWAPTTAEAIARAYDATERISFEGAHYRRDIGRRAVS